MPVSTSQRKFQASTFSKIQQQTNFSRQEYFTNFKKLNSSRLEGLSPVYSLYFANFNCGNYTCDAQQIKSFCVDTTQKDAFSFVVESMPRALAYSCLKRNLFIIPSIMLKQIHLL